MNLVPVCPPKVYAGILVLRMAIVRGGGPFEGQGLVRSNKVTGDIILRKDECCLSFTVSWHSEF